MTDLKYMTHQELLEDTAQILKVLDTNGKKVLILNQTIFFPQGGGSPYDQGEITGLKGKFEVEEVRFIEGEVHHIGTITEGSFSEDEKVKLIVDPIRREMIAKLQSAGHLIDMAMRDIGKKNLIPIKGFHFPEGPSVEYLGSIPEVEREQVKQDLQNSINKMIEQGYEVKIQMTNKEDAEKLCYVMPPHLPENKPIRIVAVWNDEYMPCGAIHVKNISQLKGLTVTKIKSNGENVKISYVI